MKRYFDEGEYEAHVKGFVEQYQAMVAGMFEQTRKNILTVLGKGDYVYAPDETCPPEYAYVPLRKYRAPLVHVDDFIQGDPELEAAYKAYMALAAEKKIGSTYMMEAFTEYYMNGKRSLYEVARLALMENGFGTIELVHAFVQLLIKYGLVEVVG